MEKDELSDYWETLQPKRPAASFAPIFDNWETTLYAAVSDHWDTFVIPGARWKNAISRMKIDADRMIHEARPQISAADAAMVLRRFLQNYGYMDS